jgi:aminotransferase MxcL
MTTQTIDARDRKLGGQGGGAPQGAAEGLRLDRSNALLAEARRLIPRRAGSSPASRSR